MSRTPQRPDVSRFMGIDYSISYVPKGTLKHDESDVYGLTDHSEQTIQIEDGNTPAKECEVVVHECLHQMLGTANLGLDEETEERVVTFLGAALTGHIRDNPAYWRWLLAKMIKRKRKPVQKT